MIVPAVSGASLQGLLGASQPTSAASTTPGGLSLQEPAQPTGAAGAAGVGEAGAASGGEGAGTSAAEALGSGESVNFGGALSEAISSLQSTQQSASSASQALALGTAKDPESAVMTVENAQLAMDLAAQIRSKATEAVQTIFQTQV
jgi:flagellar hook-basal body complex protein FliE